MLFAYKLPTSERLDLSITVNTRDYKIELPEESAIKLRDYLNKVYPVCICKDEYRGDLHSINCPQHPHNQAQ